MKYNNSRYTIKLWITYLVILCIPCTLLPIFKMPINVTGYFILLLAMYLIFFIMVDDFWCYPIVNKRELTITNVLYKFHKKTYQYDSILRIEVCQASYVHWPCVKIYTSNRRRPYFHYLDCMSQDSIPAFLNELNSHGVKAICTVDYK